MFSFIPLNLQPFSQHESRKNNRHISGMDNYDARIFFVDAEAGTETDITGMADFTYTFNHTPEKDPTLEDRFNLRFSPRTETGMEDYGMDKIISYVSGNDLIVTSSEANPILSVAVYDLQGRCLSQKEAGKVTSCKIENVFHAKGVYILKIHTTQGINESKIIR